MRIGWKFCADQWECFPNFGVGLKLRFDRLELEMPLSAPDYWLEWTKNYFRCQFTHVGELIIKKCHLRPVLAELRACKRSTPPIYRLTTAISDIDQTNINRDIRDGNWLSNPGLRFGFHCHPIRPSVCDIFYFWIMWPLEQRMYQLI